MNMADGRLVQHFPRRRPEHGPGRFVNVENVTADHRSRFTEVSRQFQARLFDFWPRTTWPLSPDPSGGMVERYPCASASKGVS